MKYLCDACSRLVTVGAFEVREDVLVLTCPVCEAESRSGPERHAPVIELARPMPPPQGPLCPKCGAERVEGREDCVRCGLLFALYRPETFALPEPVEALWRAVEESWNDPARHEAFVEACSRAQLLPEAARRYRLRTEQNPNDALALRFRDDVFGRLMSLGALPIIERPPREETGGAARLLTLLAILVFGAALFGFLYYFSRPTLIGLP